MWAWQPHLASRRRMEPGVLEWLRRQGRIHLTRLQQLHEKLPALRQSAAARHAAAVAHRRPEDRRHCIQLCLKRARHAQYQA